MRESPKHWPWFALAFALYPVLHIAAINPGQAERSSVAIAVVVMVLAALAILLLLLAWLGSGFRAGLATTWILILFFSFGTISVWLQGLVAVPDGLDFAMVEGDNSRIRVGQSAVWALLLLLGLLLARRLPAGSPRAVGTLNLVALILLGIVGVRWASQVTGGADVVSRPPEQLVAVVGRRPDIYFIVLDGYARADTLKSYYGFDNRPFLDSLRQQGFEVLGASTTNYNWTHLSLPSMLNFDYLPALLGEGFDEHSGDRSGVYGLIRDNAAARFLRARGYRFLHLQSTWSGTGANPDADQFISCAGGLLRDDYWRTIAETSWLYALFSQATMQLASCHLNNLETLAELAREPGPKFVFAHFLPPHHPYLFDRDGRILRNARLTDQFDFQNQLWSQKEPYLEQLEYMNKRIGEVVERLVADSAVPPIIVLQSDHGPSLHAHEGPEQRRIRFANLSAVRLPGAPAGWLPDDTTAVNLFPRLLNQAFGGALTIRSARFFASDFSQPFTLREFGADGVRIEPPPP